jgi:hypothetical protein
MAGGGGGKFPAAGKFFCPAPGFSHYHKSLAGRLAGFPGPGTGKQAAPNSEWYNAEQGSQSIDPLRLLACRRECSMPDKCGIFSVVQPDDTVATMTGPGLVRLVQVCLRRAF